MISSVLVANRGEIARRVFRTCRELGIATVAVHSDADADAPHVREADAAVRLPGDAPADTYLRGDLIVKAALAAGADAVHPGYGFLSENAGFAAAVTDAGLRWIGPPPAAIEAMASKTRAKELMAGAGVPLLAPLDPDAVTAADLPLLIKAAAGGGGRGMRIVRTLGELPDALAAAGAEAASAFGDGEVFLEPYVVEGRHVEVQILADAHGTVWALGTRDCSLQRRHQKVIEEAPAPGLDDALRRTLHDSATEAARAIGYRGAGTVEFLLSGDGQPYFLEMNTRLQVEHPVTEAVHGVDLVALQLRVAEGQALEPQPPEPTGHAVEARLYAEDPAHDWQPQTGTLHHFRVPGDVRLDSGVTDGDTIGVHYDPMLAKVIAWAPTRAEAVRRLAHALERALIHGPVTNRDLLVGSLRHPDFVAARLDTGFYDRHLAELTAHDATRHSREGLSALAAALADAHGRSRFGGFRNVPSQQQTKTLPGRARRQCRPRGPLPPGPRRTAGRGLPRRTAADPRPGPSRPRSRRAATGVHRRPLRRPGPCRLPARRARLHRTAPLPRPHRPHRARLAARPDARHGRTPRARPRRGRPRHRGPALAVAGGDEDGTQDHRAGRRHPHGAAGPHRPAGRGGRTARRRHGLNRHERASARPAPHDPHPPHKEPS